MLSPQQAQTAGGLEEAETTLNPNGYIITQSTSEATGNTISIGTSTTVTLQDTNITSNGEWAAEITNLSTVNLILEGTNILRSDTEPGLSLLSGNTAIISGPGELFAYGGTGGAGIGGGASSGTLIINSGSVSALGGSFAAGIGGGWAEDGANGGTVTINGGTVTAQGGGYGAGFGGGINAGHSSIRINGGSVRAIGGYITPAVSGTPMPAPYNTAGAPLYLTTVTLDGLTEATPVSSLLTLSGFAPFTYGTTGMKTDAGGKFYLYLPSGIRTIAADTENGPFGGNIINSGTSGSLYAPSEGGILAYAVSPGGSFDPDGSIPAEYGEDVTIDFVPAAGYGLAHLYVDCAEVDIEGDSYTFGNVSEPHVITGFFISNTITASSGFGGSISPSGAVPVGYGRDITFTFEANDG